MTESTNAYWQLIEPFFEQIDIYNGPKQFADSVAEIPHSSVLLYAAHMSSSEIHNGGFLQLFWNNTGLIVPEAIEVFRTIGMPTLSNLIAEASLPLGTRYPRDRNDRWDSLLLASGRTTKDIKNIFKAQKNLYLAFAEATKDLPFDTLNSQFWEHARTENGGFEVAADRYAQSILRSNTY